MNDPDLLTDDEAKALRAMIDDAVGQTERRPRQKFYDYFPDTGPYRRSLYAKHMEFFAAGAEYNERLFMAANRVGKTEGGAFEVTCHLTGLYPTWWEGRRFTDPIEVWACGTTSETTRDVVQSKLLGPWDRPEVGGMIPPHLVITTTPRPHGLRGSVESAYIRHSSGGKSVIGFKTYEQGRKSFEGAGKHLIWDDEEPPADVYQEQVYRILTTGGLVIVTFTPLQGMSEVVTGYLEPSDEARDVKMYVQAGWDDVPHLDEKMKRQVLATTLPYQIGARTKGEPSLGAGAIYPIPEADIKVPARAFPMTWPRGYGLDVGWNRTAAPFFTQDVGSGIYYLYDIHYMSAGEPPSHAMGIRARGEWLIGAIDPAANGRAQEDGRRLIDSYTALGLNLVIADHAIETGLLDTWTLLISGQLKVCENCEPWFREFRKYHRDEAGKIVKGNDHAMDACFSGDTEVLTSLGPQRIRDLVGREGAVLSLDGGYAAYAGARLVFRDVPVVRVEFEDGHSVTCTPDHPFLTTKGWTRADHLVGERCYNAVTQRNTWHPHASRSSLPVVRSFRDDGITFVDSIFNAMASAFTAWCGWRSEAPFPRVCTSTITTRTERTTGSVISDSRLQAGTHPITIEGTRDPSLHRLDVPQRDGIRPQPVSGSIASSTPERKTKFTSERRLSASSATDHLRPSRLEPIDSVPMVVRRSRVRRLAWTMRNVLAWAAARCSWSIATIGNVSAREAALTRVTGVSNMGRSDVYCLTVPGLSAFALANGVVTHNTRYWVKSGRDSMRAKPKTKSDREIDTRGGKGTWMR